MDAALVVLAVVVLFGGMVLMLAMGYESTERERERRAKAREAEATAMTSALLTVPGFFVRPDTAAPLGVVFDDMLVDRLEHHVRREQALVAQFVHHPSVDNLYRHPGTPLQMH